MATERSLLGNHSATVFTPAGMADASVRPSNPRKVASDNQPPAAACRLPAIDQAIAASVGTWPAVVSKVFVSRHDYGPLFAKDNGFAKFPELHLEVETYEV